MKRNSLAADKKSSGYQGIPSSGAINKGTWTADEKQIFRE
jgi:hypothetical protein